MYWLFHSLWFISHDVCHMDCPKILLQSEEADWCKSSYELVFFYNKLFNVRSRCEFFIIIVILCGTRYYWNIINWVIRGVIEINISRRVGEGDSDKVCAQTSHICFRILLIIGICVWLGIFWQLEWLTCGISDGSYNWYNPYSTTFLVGILWV